MPADVVKELQRRLDAGEITDPEQVIRVQESIAAYESRMAEASTPQRYSAGTLGDPRNLSGAEAIEQADESLPARQPKKRAQKQKLQKDLHPDLDAITSTLAEQNPDWDEVTLRENALQMADTQSVRLGIDNTLPSLSQSPALFRPPKSQVLGTEGVPFVNYHVFYEPSLDQFKAEMGDTLKQNAGIDMEGITENSTAYKRYADAKWAMAYDEAEKSGYGIVRASQMDKDETFGRGALLNTLKHPLSFMAGVEQTATLGVPSAAVGAVAGPKENAEFDALAQASPAGTAGQMAGYLAPGAAPGQMLGFGKGLAGVAKSGIGRVGQGVAIGAGTAAGEQAGRDIVDKVALSAAEDPLFRPKSWEEIAADAGEAGAYGLLGGVFGGGIAEGARGLKRTLQKSVGTDLATMEGGGIEPRIRPGNNRGASARALEDYEIETGISREKVIPRRIAKPMAQAALKNQKQAARELLDQRDKYFDWFEAEGKEKLRLNEVEDSVHDLLSSRVDELGEKLPGTLEMAPFKRVYEDLYEMKRGVTPREEHALRAEGWKSLQSVPFAEDILGADVQRTTGRRYTTWLRPKSVTPRELETILKDLHDKTKGTAWAKDEADAAWRSVDRSFRRVRDRMPQHPDFAPGSLQAEHPSGATTSGYSALNTRIAEVMDEVKRSNVRAGLPEELTESSRTWIQGQKPTGPLDLSMKEAEWGRFKKAIENWDPSDPDQSDLLQFARMAGVGSELELQAAMKAARRMSDQTTQSVVLGQSGANVRTLGTASKLGLRGTSVLNRVAAEPGAARPKISPKLRGLLRLLKQRGIGKLPPPGGMPADAIPTHSALGMGLGGGAVLTAGRTRESAMTELPDEMKSEVALGVPAGGGAPVKLSESEERGMLDWLVGKYMDALEREEKRRGKPEKTEAPAPAEEMEQ